MVQLPDMDQEIERPLQLVLVRHAESVRNEAKKDASFFADEYARNKVRGQADYETPLTDVGQAQARITGHVLKQSFGQFDYIYHSGFRRTVQTVEEMLNSYTPAEQERMRVRMSSFIRERDPGYTYDMTEKEAKEAFPYMAEYWKTFGGFFAAPPGGESLAEVTQRIYTFLDTVFRDRAGQKVLVVTHAGAIRAFRFLLEQWDYDQALNAVTEDKPKTCGVTVYSYDRHEKRLMLKGYNHTYY
jgi:broad specificity phosphatase PhoE